MHDILYVNHKQTTDCNNKQTRVQYSIFIDRYTQAYIQDSNKMMEK